MAICDVILSLERSDLQTLSKLQDRSISFMQRYAILKQIDVKGYFSECKKPCFHITFFYLVY
jgi:hypothetical protein